MTIYVDSLFVLNTVINGLLLLGSARLAGAPICRWRTVLAAALGGLYAVGCVLPGLTLLRAAPVKAVLMAAMLVLAFGWKRTTIKLGVLFLALSFAFCGVVVGMLGLFGSSLMLIGGAAYYPVSGKVLILTMAVVYILARTVFARIAQHSGGELIPVVLSLGAKTTKLTALRDTGNTLKDPLTNRGILVADWQVARSLLPPEVSERLRQEQFTRPSDLLPYLTEAVPAGKWRLTPYRAVGTSGGLLLTMKCDQMKVGKHTVPGALVALSPTPVSDGGAYTALIGGNR